jgi:leader peptidase (prepilin peptidase)/N-methyltransferase
MRPTACPAAIASGPVSAPLAAAPLVAAGFGASLGTLAPLAVHRLSVEVGASVRAACPHCAHRFPDGPRGWLRPGARCQGCRSRLGPSTVLTSIATAVSFGLLTAALPDDPALPAFLAVAAVGVLLAGIDLACLRLPDPLVATALGLAGAGLAGASVVLGTAGPALRGLFAALATAAGYVVLALLPGSRLGFGDVKLAGVLGLLLGWVGWDAVLLGLVLPHLLNAPVVGALLLSGRVRRDHPLPLGPALLAGALLAVVCGG